MGWPKSRRIEAKITKKEKAKSKSRLKRRSVSESHARNRNFKLAHYPTPLNLVPFAPKRRWFQFSLWALLVAVICSVALLSLLVISAARQAIAAELTFKHFCVSLTPWTNLSQSNTSGRPDGGFSIARRRTGQHV